MLFFDSFCSFEQQERIYLKPQTVSINIISNIIADAREFQ